MLELIATMGISGSGKTYYSKKYEEAGYIRINMDLMRKMKYGNMSDQTHNKEIAQIAFAMAEYLLLQGKNIVFDSVATHRETRELLLKMAQKHRAKTKLLVLMDSMNIDLCAARVKKDLAANVERSDALKDETLLSRQQ